MWVISANNTESFHFFIAYAEFSAIKIVFGLLCFVYLQDGALDVKLNYKFFIISSTFKILLLSCIGSQNNEI